MALGNHVARRPPPAVAFIVGAQPALERPVRQLLQLRVERRPHREAVLVEHLRAVLLLEVLAYFLDEVRRDARRLRRRAARDDRLLLRRVGLLLREVVLVRHPLQDDVAALRRALHVDERALALRRLENARDERRFLERQLLVRLVEVEPRRRLDAVRAVAEVHLVAVDREDLFLRVALLDLDREDRLAHLALERLLLGEPELLLQVARELLRERARPLRAPPLEDVGERGDEDAPDVHAEVPIEFGVLGGDDRLPQQRVDVVVADHDAPLRGELTDHLAAAGGDAGDRARGVVVERRHLRQIAGEREHDAAQNPEHRGHDEQRDDAGIAGDADDDVSHRFNCSVPRRLRVEVYKAPLNFYTQSTIRPSLPRACC